MNRSACVFLVAITVGLSSLPAVGQQSDDPPAPPTTDPSRWPSFSVLGGIGSDPEDRYRIGQILGREAPHGLLIRSPSSRFRSSGSEERSWGLISPELRVVRNSHLPVAENDGTLWPGRGVNTLLRGGFHAESGPVRLIFAPELAHSENRPFPMIHSGHAGRSAFSSPWYVGGESADLPVRFGNRPIRVFSLGQSSLAVEAGRLAVGLATENQWWGPGIRNAIVMSNHAPGIPHLFARTARPVRTSIGDFEATWMVGALTESLYFDVDPANDLRSLSAAALTFHPAGEPNLAIGLARAVYRPVPGAGSVPGRAFDVFTSWRSERADTAAGRGGDPQIFSVFARWVLPDDGFEAYFEWARTELPNSLRDLLTAPNHTQGYTVGGQWARPITAGSALRLQAELTYLEESSTFRHRPLRSYYTSAVAPQGYTQRGRQIGAAIGPGGSAQWIGVDYLAEQWRVGLFGSRSRRDNAVYYHVRPNFRPLEHDVTMLGGARAGFHSRYLDVGFELIRSNRMNFLFQSRDFASGTPVGYDVRNHTLRLTVTPKLDGL